MEKRTASRPRATSPRRGARGVLLGLIAIALTGGGPDPASTVSKAVTAVGWRPGRSTMNMASMPPVASTWERNIAA